MALKKSAQNAQEGAGRTENGLVVDNTQKEKKPVRAVQNGADNELYSDYQQYVYIGPSLSNGALKENTVLEGSFSEVLDFLSAQVEDYPQIKQLIVPVNRLAEYAAKVKRGGNIISRYYKDIVSAMQGNREG